MGTIPGCAVGVAMPAGLRALHWPPSGWKTEIDHNLRAMEPIVLIHGYSAESKDTTEAAIASIYGALPKSLKAIYDRNAVVAINLSRYVSLEDGITVDDISRALDRALRTDYPKLLQGRFHVIIHSTGALVIRNWIRKFSPKPSPLANLVYLAGANLGR